MVPREHPTSSVKNSIEISRICLKAMSPEMFRCYSRVFWLFSLSFVSFHPRVTTQICQMVVTSSRSDTGRRRRRTTNSLHQLSPEFSFSRPVMETTPSQQGKSWAYSIIARMIWSTLDYCRTTFGAQYIVAEQDSGPPTPSQCDQFCPS